MVTVDSLTTTYNGLSTDEKPTEARNGDKFRELNTGTVYIFDEDNGEWSEMASSGSSGGGGGSSSGGGVLYGNVTEQESDEGQNIYEVDLSFNDIKEAIEDGKSVIFKVVIIEIDEPYYDEYTFLQSVVSLFYSEENGTNPLFRVTVYDALGNGAMDFYSTSASEHMTTQEPGQDDGGDHPID